MTIEDRHVGPTTYTWCWSSKTWYDPSGRVRWPVRELRLLADYYRGQGDHQASYKVEVMRDFSLNNGGR